MPRLRRLAALIVTVATAAVPAACDAPGRAGADASHPEPGAPADSAPGYRLGDPDAPVAVVEFSDFGCPYCARFARTTFPAIRDDYIRSGRVRWRYVPVTFGFPGGQLMAAAAVCAAASGGPRAFWAVHDLLYTRQVALRGPDGRSRLLPWLAEMGLDAPAIERCIDSDRTRATLEANNRAAAEWLVQGTPTFVINGVPVSGAHPVDFFRKMLDTALDPSTL